MTDMVVASALSQEAESILSGRFLLVKTMLIIDVAEWI